MNVNQSHSSNIVLSILLVNYNGISLLPQCLDSIGKHVDIPHEIILVDNASQDGSVEHIRLNYPNVKIIENIKNSGFAAGNNIGARVSKGSFLLLLNTDTMILSKVAPLIDMLKSDQRIGVIGCSLLHKDGRQQESFGNLPNVASIILSWSPLPMIFPEVNFFCRTVHADSGLYLRHMVEVGWVTGAFLLTRKDLWLKLDGLDTRYFMYMEDTDYCRRVFEEGYKIVYSSACKVTHLNWGGRSWIGEKAIIDSTNSYIIYTKKYYKNYGNICLRIALAPLFLLRSIVCFFMQISGVKKDGINQAKAFGKAAAILLFGAFPFRSKGDG